MHDMSARRFHANAGDRGAPKSRPPEGVEEEAGCAQKAPAAARAGSADELERLAECDLLDAALALFEQSSESGSITTLQEKLRVLDHVRAKIVDEIAA
jgi:hypothetical protein